MRGIEQRTAIGRIERKWWFGWRKEKRPLDGGRSFALKKAQLVDREVDSL